MTLLYFLKETRMSRCFLVSCLIAAVSIASNRSSHAQPPSAEHLSPYLQQRIDAAIVHLAVPQSQSTQEFIQPFINELEVQLGIIKKKQERFAGIKMDTVARLSEMKNINARKFKEWELSGSSRETIELLLRNCELELQRLNWQVAAAEVPTQSTAQKLREELAHSRLRDFDLQMMAANRQALLQAKRLQQIVTMTNAGQAPNSDLMQEQARSEEVEAALESAKRKREEFVIQMRLDQATETEKFTLDSNRLEKQRTVLENEIKNLRTLHEKLEDADLTQLTYESHSDRIRSLNRVMDQLMIQQTELETLIEFLTSRLRPKEDK